MSDSNKLQKEVDAEKLKKKLLDKKKVLDLRIKRKQKELEKNPEVKPS